MTLDDERNDDLRPPRQEQRSVWEIPAGWGRAWLTIFSILSAMGFVVAVLHQIFDWAATEAIISVIIVMAVVFSVAAVSAFLILRGVKVLTMLAYWLEQQANKIRDRNIARGRAESDARWREWYQRQVDRGIPVEEPPPPENPDGKE